MSMVVSMKIQNRRIFAPQISHMKKEVYIVSAVRTPMGSFGGVLKDVPATMLGGNSNTCCRKKGGYQS